MSGEKLKPVTRIIDGHSVEVTPFPARPALLYKYKLLQLLGGPLIDLIKGPIAGLLKRVKPGTAVSREQLAGFLDLDLKLDGLTSHIFDTLDPEKSTELIFDMCACVRFDNHEMTETFINATFASSLSKLYRIFFFVLEVNYKDFLELLGITGKAIPVKAATPK